MKNVFISIFVFVFVLMLHGLDLSFAQEDSRSDSNKNSPEFNKAAPMQFGYRNVRLGMTWNDVQQRLSKDNLVQLEPVIEPDFFGPRPNRLIRAHALPFILRIDYHFFSLSEWKPSSTKQTDKQKNNTWVLYEIMIQWNPDYETYQSLYTYLQDKYGKASVTRSYYSVWRQSMDSTLVEANSDVPIDNRIVLNTPTVVRVINWTLLEWWKKKWPYRQSKNLSSYQNQIQQDLMSGL